MVRDSFHVRSGRAAVSAGSNAPTPAVSRNADERQHYLPASLIGRFSFEPGSGKRLRSRPVYVMRRGQRAPFGSAAKRVAYVPGMYEPSAGGHPLVKGFSLERMWQGHEASLPSALDEIETSHHALAASTWCETLVPFATSLLVRTPEFLARYRIRLGDIEINDRDNALSSAVVGMSRLLTPVMAARWTLLRAPDGEPFVTTDGGWFASQFNGTADPGLIVPISPVHALAIEPRYRREIAVAAGGEWTAPVDTAHLDADQMGLMRRWAANFALTEVYGPDETVVSELRDDIGHDWFADPWMLGFLDGRRLVPTELDWWPAACAFRRPPGQAGFRPPDLPSPGAMAELPTSFPLMLSPELPPTSGLEIADDAVVQHLFLDAFMIAPEGMTSIDIPPALGHARPSRDGVWRVAADGGGVAVPV